MLPVQLALVGLLSLVADAASIPMSPRAAVSPNPLNVLDRRGFFVRCPHSGTPTYCLPASASCKKGKYVTNAFKQTECTTTWACFCDNDTVDF
ncbi:hypothetical protein JDV02_002930 [Purpureocillium takamizusanense]|uniref:Antifungal protein n=1 Tax=Purpureocillium takamizusanense TaxID=2060973 RepID=A0A9Q8QCJ4_9HYPO|nr:uncharacterized protein JDV02_002930 [Purpureocillium takamizusanense]UNI16499.1 hypothetical protein JDV02_002930 [Purpureocillium takamizusanense]